MNASLRSIPAFPQVSTIRSISVPWWRGHRWLAKRCVIRVLSSDTAAGPRKYHWPTPQHISLWTQDKIIHTNPDIHGNVNEGIFYLANYTTFTELGTFHIYRMIPTQLLLNTYTEGDASIMCTDQIRQSYCGTNGNLRLCKISYLQYVKNKTPVSWNTFARLVCSKLNEMQTWASEQFGLKMCKSTEW
jgi:hypothetical protein